jgi:uncharacterized glyoxalase superfamily protein PhnB
MMLGFHHREVEHPIPEEVKTVDPNTEIYPMPSFPNLNVSDLAVSSRWYQEALGFTHIFTMSAPDGRPLLAHLRWVKYADILLNARPLPPGPHGVGIVLTYSAYLAGRTVTEIAARAEQYGADIASPPEDKPWNARECTIRDPDGFLITFSEPINLGRTFDSVIADATKKFDE